MNLLVIGNGGREHAIASVLKKSNHAEKIFVSPGNGGTEIEFENITLDLTPPFNQVLNFCKQQKIGLVVIGPENYLSDGITDFLQEKVPVFGPSQKAAQLESSKILAKKIMSEAKIPTADYQVLRHFESAKKIIQDRPIDYVLKADGLCGGKGVILPKTKSESLQALEDFLVHHRFGSAGKQVIIEDRLPGSELSVLGFCDGEKVRLLPASQDHKRAFDGDLGPNTGGMGAYTPVKFLTDRHLKTIEQQIFLPLLQTMAAKGTPYKGILYAGLMLDEVTDSIKVVEFNVRFGDPECQCVLPLLKSDPVEIMLACIQGGLDQVDFEIESKASCTVILASKGYPQKYAIGKTIYGLDQLPPPGIQIFHAGTRLKQGRLETAGGRVLGLSAFGHRDEPLSKVIKKCYQALEKIQFEDCFHRTDIGQKGI